MQAPEHDAGATAGKGGGGGRGGIADGGTDATGTAGTGGAGGRGGGVAGNGAGGRGGGVAGNGTGGRGGAAGTGGRGGTAGGAGGTAGGSAGSGGRGGASGGGGQTTVDAGCAGPGDAAVAPGPCTATFNFESGLQGAMLGAQAAFQTPISSNAQGYCGKSLAIPAMFSGTSGITSKGEILIPLSGAPVDLTGKTITIAIAADPGCNPDVDLNLVVNTQGAPVPFSIPSVGATWQVKLQPPPPA